MASFSTANYQLNQWVGTDSVLRTEFNEDNVKVDTALKTMSDQIVQKANQSAVNTLVTAVQQKADQADLDVLESSVQQITADLTKITFGTYTGDGTDPRTVSLGFTPKAVLVMQARGMFHSVAASGRYQIYGGLALLNFPAVYQEYPLIQITEGGFTVRSALEGSAVYLYTNVVGILYHYIALS